MLQIYTGEGKGKTTAALGLAMRALGWKKKVIIIQFIKGNAKIGEKRAEKFFNDKLQIYQFFKSKSYAIGKPGKKYQRSVNQAYAKTIEILKKKSCDILILDEICNAIYYKLLGKEKVLEIIKIKPAKIELILTGRYCPDWLIAKADLVTEMKLIKHYFQKGIKARKGIEY